MNMVNEIVALVRSRPRAEQGAVIEAVIYTLAEEHGDSFVARISRHLPQGWVEAQAMRAYLSRQPA